MQLYQTTMLNIMPLMEHAVKKNGIEKVELEVYESNVNAIKLYEKFGFAYEGKRIRSRKLDGFKNCFALFFKALYSDDKQIINALKERKTDHGF